MKILHTADLHIGKLVNGFSMLEEQAHSLHQIIGYINSHHVDVLIIAGDVYDKKMPSDAAVSLFDDFLSRLSELEIPVFMISGNHDSGPRLEFAKDILKRQNIYISGSYKGSLEKIVLQDNFGPVNFYLCPFLKPSDIRAYDPSVRTYHDALKTVIDRESLNLDERNVFIGHQFFSSGQELISESEIISVGGSESVGYNLLEDFDYAALGHLHNPQRLGSDYIRYSGSITVYSESEVTRPKSVVVLDLKDKGTKTYELLALEAYLGFRSLKGSMDEIMALPESSDYVFITLTDDHVLDAMNKLRSKFKNIMSLDFDNLRTQHDQMIEANQDIKDIPVDRLFEDFYRLQNNQDLSERQKEIVKELIERIEDHASH